MRAAAIVVALAVTLAGPTRADGEAAVDLDLDAFADHLADALRPRGPRADEDVALAAWEERLEPAAEDDWLAGRDPPGPAMDDQPAPRRAPTVGLTVSVGGDVLVITRLVFADARRADAVVARALLGFIDLPLAAGTSGRRLPAGPVLIEARGHHLLIVRARSSSDLDLALLARTEAWEAGGVPAPTEAASGVALIDRDLLAIACVGGGPLRERLAARRDPQAWDHEVVAGGVGFWCRGTREADARATALRLARALGLDVDLPAPESPEPPEPR